MTLLRSLAVFVFALGAATLGVALVLLGRAPGLPEATRHLRAMKDRDDPPADVRTLTMADFAHLPPDLSLPRRAALEAHGVRMQGWIQRIVLSADGDLHLELVEKPRLPGGRDTAYVVAEITPPWRRQARAWAYESLLVAFRPNHGGPAAWEAGPRAVRLTGWLLFDPPYHHPVSTWLQLNGAPRRTGWEIHPVTRIELWDDAAAAWRELVR
jgi:hypothetical protein